MKKLLVVFTLLLTVGCTSTGNDKRYYQLSSPLSSQLDKAETLKPRVTGDFIWLESVDVASHLNKTGIVYQTDAVKYITAANNLWVASLSDQLSSLIVNDLSILLPNRLVSNRALTTPTTTIKVFIDNFNGRYTGDAIIQGRWVIIYHNGEVITKNFSRKIALAESGYDALVDALARGWLEEESELIKSVKL